MGHGASELTEFWGKTCPAEQAHSSFPFKPVVHHLLDVAAVALRLQELSLSRLARELAVMGIPLERVANVSAWLAGLHDLGKFSLSFQAKRPDLFPKHLPPIRESPSDRGHWRNTAIMLRSPELQRELHSIFPAVGDGLALIAASIAGHHGRPPTAQEYRFNIHGFRWEKEVTPPSLAAGLQAMHLLRGLLAPHPLPEIDTTHKARALSWRLAGLTTLADWIGSDNAFFRFEDPAMPVDAYWRLALRRADDAIDKKGLLPARLRNEIGFAEMVPGIAPRPMQAAADSVALPEGPALFVIEDATGSGKTEAALVLSARLMDSGRAEGLYFALPTMATANAMYGRLENVYARLFEQGSRPSVVLAHGRADLSPEFMRNVGTATNGMKGEEDNATFCSEWIADNRRKAFFAQLGAGTIDQAFLAVLKKKHLTLRQYGLAGRVLIVDEAHAFDAYMGKELETLLEVQASLGGSAIVLSATLPAAKRQSIVDAFRRGLGKNDDAGLGSTAYPLLTAVGRDTARELPVEFGAALCRQVTVERLSDAASAHDAAMAAAANGAAVVVIRNAVDEAIASFEALRERHAETMLFHARFAMCDRQRIERDVLERFGRGASAERRNGRILVATQVVEQSLDLDFDVVISDLAPVDLLIQRAGRLWRHMDRRPVAGRAVPSPTLYVISPELSAATHDKWLEPALGAGAFVYRHLGLMWRTAKLLFEAGSIRTPDDLRPFIERVYGCDDVPECLRAGQDKAEGGGFGDRQLAGQNLIDYTQGYASVGELSPDQEIGTRLGEETVTLRLARHDGARLVPWAQTPVDGVQSKLADAATEEQLWAMSEVSPRRRWVGNPAPPGDLLALVEAARSTWPDWERAIIAVVEDGQVLLDGDSAASAYNGDIGLSKRIPKS